MIVLSKPIHPVKISLKLGGSKSLSNRVLVLNQVLNLDLHFQNLSDADDTRLLQQALLKIKNNQGGLIDLHHAGSDMRFLTALLAAAEGEWILTGSQRLKQRPVGELVAVLEALGAEIKYTETEQHPPLKIKGKKLRGGKAEIDGSISSQFISALLMAAPCFEQGLELSIKGEIVSRPYIQMTIALLKEFGINVQQTNTTIRVQKQETQNTKQETRNRKQETRNIESDWSSASYWYSICALSPGSEIELHDLIENSLQADAILPELFSRLGVKTAFRKNSVLLTHKKSDTVAFEYDFTCCPDIAQTLAVACFGLGISARLTGLKTLKIKETDRITALKTELEKFGATVKADSDAITIQPPKQETRNKKQETILINTYNDHRMAMSFAPLALVRNNICIQNPDVVSKSYPNFWHDLKSAGFNVNLQP